MKPLTAQEIELIANNLCRQLIEKNMSMQDGSAIFLDALVISLMIMPTKEALDTAIDVTVKLLREHAEALWKDKEQFRMMVEAKEGRPN